MKQLELFPLEAFIIPKPLFNPYWKDFFNWEPTVGCLARIDTITSFCDEYMENRYCYGMQVRIISIDGHTAKVSPTEKWVKACVIAGTGGYYNESQIWSVDTYWLAPIF